MAPKKCKSKGYEPAPIFFHKEWEDFGFMSNYTPAAFSAPDPTVVSSKWLVSSAAPPPADDSDDAPDAIEFKHSEQYYMYCKAVCFGDMAVAQRILAATNASDCKDAAREIRGFDDAVWSQDGRKLRVMADALWFKFGGPALEDAGSWLSRDAKMDLLPDVGRKLLATGDKMLVEAAGRDSFWGIGYGVKQGPMRYQKNWGQNHLGKCLMATRERMRGLLGSAE